MRPTDPRPDRLTREHTTLGRAARLMRAVRGLSQEEVANRGGLHRNYVGAIERGEINPTFRVLLKLSRGLALPLADLIAQYEVLLHEPGTAVRRLHDPRSGATSEDRRSLS